MATTEQDRSSTLSSFDILVIVGFAFYCYWLLDVFFWLFCDFPPGSSVAVRDLMQMWLFIGIPVGHALQHLLGKRSEYNLLSNGVFAAELICSLLLPVAALTLYLQVPVPIPFTCTCAFLAGMAASFVKVAWLDVFSRMGDINYERFCSLGLVGGGILLALGIAAPDIMQPVFAIACCVFGLLLLHYSTRRAKGNKDKAPLESKAKPWKFAREVVPSFFMFGVVFAISFVYLFNTGRTNVLLGLSSCLIGAIVIALMSLRGKTGATSVTTYQRVLVIITAIACIATPFVPTWAQVTLSCVVVAAWAVLSIVNSTFVLRKCAITHEAPLFRQAPIRLLALTLGFACGWAIATLITALFEPHAIAFTYMRLLCAVALIVVIMVFLPVSEHHAADGTSGDDVEEKPVPTTVLTVDMSESDLLKARCKAVAKLYQLSPREEDVLEYLARGRNAAYIQEQLTISPHTVKSHIYNIYRKLDIHSQQKLMDFVETFPLD